MTGVAGDHGDGDLVGVGEAVRSWADFLVGVTGCSVGTADCYGRHVRPFLRALVGSDGVAGLRGVRAEQVRSYVTDLGDRYAAGTCKVAATSIRSFLRYALLSGWTTSDLRGAVGPVITHPYGRLPKALSAGEVQRLLASPDRSTGAGVRDYAMLLLLVRLGLRAGEVAALRLDDIDWESATFTATVKGGSRRTYPLPEDVGLALVAYLRQRPAGVMCREAFLQVRPERGSMTSSSVTLVVARNASRAGLGTVRAHRLRHSAARAILDGGGTLAEVGELLGHNSGSVTPLYASLDLGALRAWSAPGPGRPVMTELTTLIGEYMAFRAARGFQPNRKVEHLLGQFAATLPATQAGGPLFTNSQALAWAHAPAGGAPAWWSLRLSTVRQFATYLAGSGLPVQVPAARQGPGGPRRATPYLYSDADVQALMSAAEELFTPMRGATMKTLTGLLAVTGMRLGETLKLTIGDIDLDEGIVVIAQAKYGRQRRVLLDSSSCRAIDKYLHRPDRRRLGVAPERLLLTTGKGTPVPESNAHDAFHRMTQHAGLLVRAGARPRPHDLRHSFATQTMIEAYRTGRDPARTLTLLSTWLGHSNPAETYWYLQAAPEIAAVAAKRLEEGPQP